MNYKLKSTSEGLIFVKASLVISLKRPNALDGAKILGKDLVINAVQIAFSSHNLEGKVTFFMNNGYEIAVNALYSDAEEVLSNALGKIPKEII